MINDLDLIVQSVFSTMGDIFLSYWSIQLLWIPFSIYIIRKIANIIHRLA